MLYYTFKQIKVNLISVCSLFCKRSIIIYLFIISQIVNAQYTEKKAGICFRVDDNHLASEFQQYAAIFDYYGFKFNFALNLGLINPLDTNYLNTIRFLCSSGHEMMDHTPNHTTAFFTVKTFADTNLYHLNPAIDHINQLKICLKIDSIKTNSYNDEGNIILNGNMVVSVTPGEFKNFLTGNVVNYIYLPIFNKVFSYSSLSNKSYNDPDTLYLSSFWNESINTTYTGITTYKKLGIQDVYLNRTAIYYLLNQTRKYCNEYNFPKTTSWAQPGGYWPYLKPDEIKNAFDSLGYFAGGLYNISYTHIFNQNNSLNTQKYYFGGFDFNTETETFKTIKTKIANAIAKNYIFNEINHFGKYYPLLGGWNSYLSRIDSLLNWCYQKNIPVRTYNKWVPILYDSITDPYQNIFPPLNIDLDEDGFPDGYNKTNFGILKATGGVLSSNGYCIEKKQGYFCTISSLGGIEKGNNILEFYAKGTSSDFVIVRVLLNYNNSYTFKSCLFNINNTLKKYKLEFNCPDSISTISLQFAKTDTNSNSSISGMSLRKKSVFKFTGNPKINYYIWQKIPKIDLYSLVNEPFYNKSELQFSVIQPHSLICSIDSGRFLQVKKPAPFWKDRDTVLVIISNPDDYTDTLRLFFEPNSNEICQSDTIIIEPELINNTVQILAFRSNSSTGYNLVSTPLITVIPTENTTYIINELTDSNQIVTDSFYIKVNPPPYAYININGSNPFCLNDSIILTANYSSGDKIKWFYNDSLLFSDDTIFYKVTHNTGKYQCLIKNNKGCQNWSNSVILSNIPQMDVKIPADTNICINTDTIFIPFAISNFDSIICKTNNIQLTIDSNFITFIPDSSDKAAGFSKIFVNSYGYGNCNSRSDSISVNYIGYPVKPQWTVFDTLVCGNIYQSYYHTYSDTALFHFWSLLPANSGTITSSHNSTFINWDTTFTGNISLLVSVQNQCGLNSTSDTLFIKKLKLPEKPEKPTGDTLICNNISISDYFISINSALIYIWNIYPSYSAVLNTNQNSVQTNWNSNFTGNALLTVASKNECGLSVSSDSLQIKKINLPLKPAKPIGDTIICDNTTNSLYKIISSDTNSTFIWNIKSALTDTVFYSGYQTLINWDSLYYGNILISVKQQNECGISISSDSLNILKVHSPVKPLHPSGDSLFCANIGQTTYFTSSSIYNNGYNWTLLPVNAGSINSSSNYSIINWNTLFGGFALLTVKSWNLCGNSDISQPLLINVKPLPQLFTVINCPDSVNLNNTNQTEVYCETNNSDSVIWEIHPSNVDSIIQHDSICIIYWNSLNFGEYQLKVTANNSCGNSLPVVKNIYCFYSNSTNNYEHQKDNVLIYPNPTRDGKFLIQYRSDEYHKVKKLNIYNAQGQLINSQIVISDKGTYTFTINISAYTKGLFYFSMDNQYYKILYY